LLSVVGLISFNLFNVDEFNVITEALFLVSSIWIATHFFVTTSKVSSVVMLFVSIVLRDHFFNVQNFIVTFIKTVEDNTIASLALLAFFGASIWFFSWFSFTKALLSQMWGNIFTPESTTTFNPSIWCSLSSDSEVRND